MIAEKYLDLPTLERQEPESKKGVILLFSRAEKVETKKNGRKHKKNEEKQKKKSEERQKQKSKQKTKGT